YTPSDWTPMVTLVPMATKRWKSPSPGKPGRSVLVRVLDGSSGEARLSEQAASCAAAATTTTSAAKREVCIGGSRGVFQPAWSEGVGPRRALEVALFGVGGTCSSGTVPSVVRST